MKSGHANSPKQLNGTDIVVLMLTISLAVQVWHTAPWLFAVLAALLLARWVIRATRRKG